MGERSACAVVDEDGIFLGRLKRQDAEKQPGQRARDLTTPGASTFRPDVPVTEMADWFGKRRFDEFFITTPDGRVFGVLHRATIDRLMEKASE
jgi:hypothetical protein